jgi:formylglycine-generating enzyme required for sulfatase activity
MARIFISYRRTDTSGYAELLFDRLEEHYPGEIFLDRSRIEDGARWDQVIAKELQECAALLVVIGPNWLKARDEESGIRRLDQPNDWVRREIETGLRRGVRVVPVLMGGASPPKAEHLPEAIRNLAYSEAREVHERDSRDSVARLVEHLTPAIGAPRKGVKQARQAWNPLKYLRDLYRQTEYIDIRGLAVSRQQAHRFRIDELYTPLTTVVTPGQAKGEFERQKATPLQEALGEPRLVLVGDPGAGKSTFLRRIAFAACETLLGDKPEAAQEMLGAGECPFPLLIGASSLSNFIGQAKRDRSRAWPADVDSPQWLIEYLACKSRESGWDLPGEFFAARLKENCLLLVDGLDEAADRAHRKNLAKLLARAAEVYDDSRIVAASRPSAYGGETSIDGYRTVEIAPLEDDAIATFIGNWCRSLYPEDPAGAAQHRRGLDDAISSTADIREMAVNPVMLTALAVLHWNDKRLPEQRAELYESILTWLARSREDRPGRAPAEQCLALLQHLAYTMHAGVSGKQVEIGPHAAAQALAERFRDVPEAERVETAERFLQDEEMDSGILVGRGGKLRYWHLTFQEYLAAKALAAREDDRRRLLFEEGKLYLPEWRETVLLLGGVLYKQGPERVDAFLTRMLDGLGERATLTQRARCVGLIGRILQDLRSWKYTIADPRYQENLDRALAIFDAKQARNIDFAVRVEAADAIGQAGDPRLAGDNWVRVEGGSFWMGAQKADRKGKNYDPEAYDSESPVHRVEVATFEIGRYPVTVLEYARFVDSGGYGNERFWQAGGYRKFSEPGSWQRQLRYPNRPVVEVSWYEAAAYCAWARVRLPTEAEWEYAARCGREGIRYPWGQEEPDEFRANFYHDKAPKQVTPVGLYPDGATPTGIHDLAGNVFEWAADWLRGNYAKSQHPASGYRVVRGGSWFNYARYLRVSFRLTYGPVGRSDNLGFRCARELLSP